jgi:alcohol dehydrogenase (NADP+)
MAGSNVGEIRETQEMLNFSAQHGIAPLIEVIRADQVDEVYELVFRSNAHFRLLSTCLNCN